MPLTISLLRLTSCVRFSVTVVGTTCGNAEEMWVICSWHYKQNKSNRTLNKYQVMELEALLTRFLSGIIRSEHHVGTQKSNVLRAIPLL
jgi:hypothetical protein